MDPSEELRQLITDYRDRCLWFLERDYFPQRRDEILEVLRHIERHGDLAAYRRAARMRQWLSLPRSA